MRTREPELLAYAERAMAEHPDEVALLIDLSQVPHIDDPAFFRVLIGRLQQRAQQLDAHRFDLADHRICFVVAAQAAASLDRAVASLSRLLVSHGRSSLDAQRFSLNGRPDQFLTLCRDLAAAVETRPDFNSEDDDGKALSAFLAIERNLASADISNLIREQPIVDFTNPRHPTPVAIEVFTSIRAVQDLYGVSLRRNPWLFDRVTEVLDQRMLFHLARERARSTRRLSINLHLSTVLSDPFEKFVLDPRFDWRRSLIFELSHMEMIDEPKRYAAAIARLEDMGATIAIDGIPWTSLAHMVDAPADIRLLKVEWAPALAGLDGAERNSVRECIEKIGRERVVLYHCPDADAVDTALALGVTTLQGWGVDERLERLHDAEVDAMTQRKPPEQSEPTPPATTSGWFNKTFGG
ncbi:MAG: EAL domain-containing protein [Alphaproteobacteria bacterium]|nr:EAL domain-containing protein [Alphaproteobacteria bacterium]